MTGPVDPVTADSSAISSRHPPQRRQHIQQRKRPPKKPFWMLGKDRVAAWVNQQNPLVRSIIGWSLVGLLSLMCLLFIYLAVIVIYALPIML